jgi:hypothetical protein
VQAELPGLQRPALSLQSQQAVLAAAALSSTAVRAAADAVPTLYAAMGAWRN